ncbi:MAG: hypothetical protein ACLGH3_01805 [Actinomycetota bacterium]
MTERDRNQRSAQEAFARPNDDDLDRRLAEAMLRLERVRSKALNAVETMLATR